MHPSCIPINEGMRFLCFSRLRLTESWIIVGNALLAGLIFNRYWITLFYAKYAIKDKLQSNMSSSAHYRAHRISNTWAWFGFVSIDLTKIFLVDGLDSNVHKYPEHISTTTPLSAKLSKPLGSRSKHGICMRQRQSSMRHMRAISI